MSSTSGDRNRRSRPFVRLAILVLAIAVVTVGAYGAWYLFLRTAGPAAVDLSDAPLPSTSVAAPAGGLDGTWKVDTSIGSFSDFSGTFVGYRVE
ncbi:MAG TPA: hypothetical protein VIV06_00535, partial [Candidatus Limnocylindrales bacterium]